MVRKGQVPANTVYAIVLVIIFILVIGQFIYYFLHKETTMEYFLFDVYVVKNGMSLANLYLQNSLDYSVYQAMFDNGMRGGWNEIPTGSVYDGNHSYWEEMGGVLSPSRKDLEENLRSAIIENLNEYVKGGYTFLSKYYTLPTFRADEITINDLGNVVEIFANSSKTINFHDVIEHETGEERIEINSYPKLGDTYNIDYFRLYEKSSEIFSDLKSENCLNLTKDQKIRDSVRDENYVINAVVVDKKDNPCEATLEINVTDSSAKFPVSNGINVFFGNVGMVFFVKIA